MFNKPLNELTFDDIKKLKDDKIPESKVLDYKREEIEKKALMKHVCGFANANGGFLIFGIEEDDSKPPIPKKLIGLNRKNFNIEQIEQIINGNLDPRLTIEISPPIYKSDKSSKFFIVIRVPEGSDKPYMSTADDRFYIRRNYQTPRMSEIEISSMYRQRFSAPQSVREYLDKTISYHNEIAFPKKDKEEPLVFGHAFVFPPNIERRRIGKIDDKTLDRNREGVPSFNCRTISLRGDLSLPSLRIYNNFGLTWYEHDSYNRLEFHRNYLIHHVTDYGRINKQWNSLVPFIDDAHLTFYLLIILYFSDWAYNEVEYFGPLNVLLHIENTKNVSITKKGLPPCQNKEIIIEREINSWELKEKYVEIVKSIMDEFMNYFGGYEYSDFMEGGLFVHLLDSKNKD